MLVGQYYNSIDEKGRLLVPSKFRNEIEGSTVFVAPGIDRCLRIFTPERWNVVVAEIMGSGSMFQKEIRETIRSLISPASECEIDKAGRVLIPQILRDSVSITKEVFVAGAVEYIELWCPEVYQEVVLGDSEKIVETTEKIGQLYAEKRKNEVLA